MTTTNTFQAGTIYTTGEGRDYVWRFLVVKRTAKFLTIQDTMTGQTKRVGVHTWQGVESAYPLGTYSMCPVITADSPLPANAGRATSNVERNLI